MAFTIDSRLVRPARKAARILGAIYVVVTAISCVVRHNSAPAVRTDGPVAELHAIQGDRALDRTLRVAYQEAGPGGALGVVLLHGSPGRKGDFATVVPRLAKTYRVIVPDLPGFGDSEHDIPDYSFRAHARYVLELLDALGIDDAHVVGFSMGGGVALSMADLAPKRVRSITMLSSIGVQEMELLGDYGLNHAVHGAQLAGLWGLRELTPHFGWLDDAMLGVPYARNFYDSDQRPLRGILARWTGPMLIIHGTKDPLVPIQAAREHARLVPQSELLVTRESHFMVFGEGPKIADDQQAFLDGWTAARRRRAIRPAPSASRRPRRRSTPRALPKLPAFRGFVLGLVALATFVSEDLTHRRGARRDRPARLRAGHPRLPRRDRGRRPERVLRRAHLRARRARPRAHEMDRDRKTSAACAGVVSRARPDSHSRQPLPSGDARRDIRRRRRPPHAVPHVRPLVRHRRGVVDAAPRRRFGPGRRADPGPLPSVPALGAPRGRADRDHRAPSHAARAEAVLPARAPPARRRLDAHRALGVLAAVRLLRAGRAVRALARDTAPWTDALHGGEPPIEAGGFINESKSAILDGLAAAGDAVAPWRLLPASDPPAARREGARRFALPVVLKPDAGQRGSGVVVARTWEAVDAYLAEAHYDVLLQAYVPGVRWALLSCPFEHGRIRRTEAMPVIAGGGSSRS
jgi:pimeloyl-ACP methyl ester carboxylesterase